ncbi:hypothetical protein DF037_32500 [Burkholderia contaminans]|uniref:YD repeat-containing protein n=1 Tax=Burkholderia contaminans TaxID=488447 RepID=A0A3N8Q936_9BURK|nr:hypothetical protein DF037_32500 [Burkholderia contaminans]
MTRCFVRFISSRVKQVDAVFRNSMQAAAHHSSLYVVQDMFSKRPPRTCEWGLGACSVRGRAIRSAWPILTGWHACVPLQKRDGNLATKRRGANQTQRFTYDGQNRLISVHTQDVRGVVEFRANLELPALPSEAAAA